MPRIALAFCVAGILSAGCNLAPKYHRPSMETPAVFKEQSKTPSAGTNLWQVAQPSDALARGKWWELFGEPELNKLEERVAISNQNVAAAFANFLAARAIVQETRAQLFPVITANGDFTRSRIPLSSFRGTSVAGATTISQYSLPLDASWQLDLWGRIRNSVKASAFEAQATRADLENTKLSAQAQLATAFFQLRSQDVLAQLYAETVKAYQDSYNLAKVRFQTGIASDEDLAQAETQLKTAEAQATNLGVLRAQLEHAIAILIGQAPAFVSLPTEPRTPAAPPIPPGVPSELLQRRPDVAAAERRVAEANARIGVAKAAFYPTLTLSGAAGLQSASSATLLDWASRVWSVGAAAAETVFDAGLRKATVEQFRAEYDLTVAQYRQVVLTAFQQVEDNLASLRILGDQEQQQQAAVEAAQRYLNLALNRYKLGIDSYLNVITAQTAYLQNRQTLVTLRMQRLTSSIQLIEAIGGGWNASQLSAKD
jgi:NodT family efflux transporter outer membrane factor (OMF) lipoprotein